MKTFDELFAELSEKAATRPEGSGTVARARRRRARDRQEDRRGGRRGLDGGRVPDRRATPPRRSRSCSTTCRCCMLAKGLTTGGRLPTSLMHNIRLPFPSERNPGMLRIAVPNKGTLSETAVEMLHEAGYTDPSRPARSSRSPTRATTSSSSTCARATSPPTSAPARSTSASPAATCCSTRSSAAVEIDPLDFGDSTFRFAGPDRALLDARRPRGRAGRHELRRASSATSSTANGVTADGRAPRRRRRVRRAARRRGCGRRRRRDRLDAAQAGSRDLRPRHPRVDGRAHRARGATVPGIETLRRRLQGVLVARQYVLMDYDLPAELLDAATAHHPGPRVADGVAAARPRAGSPCA